MKTKVTVTFHLSPESRGEMIDHYGALYRKYRDEIETVAQQQGLFGAPPADTHLRWILTTGLSE